MQAGLCKERFLTVALWVTGLFAAVSLHAQETEPALDTLVTATLAADTIDNTDPDWYVAPEVRADYIRAPRRTSASTCPIDSTLIFDIDSVLVEVSVFEYGDTTRTMVWTVNADGSRVGKSKTEEASTETTAFNATYAWDAATNNWKGTSKTEHVYANNKETTRIIYNTWLNNEWVADTKYTWAYDAAGRESEYTTYTRNTSTNQLMLSKQRIREYNENGTTTLEIQYTAHNGTAWSAGTKKEWGYDADGNQTLYADWAISNGNWIGSSKEEWQYTTGVLTMNAKYGWANGDWSGTLKELWVYTNGIMTFYEKYTGYSNGNWIGSLRETWEYQSGKLMLHMQYGWEAGNWVNSAKEEWTFNTSGKQTLHEQYAWSNGWTMTLQENSGYDEAGNNTLIENYTISNGVWTGTKKEEYTFNAAKKKTSTVIYQWTNGAWTGKTKEVWAFNAGNKQTLHEKYSWSDADWAITLQENSGYDAAGNTVLVENYSLTNNVWKGTKKEEYTYSGTTKTSTITYVWNADSNAFVYKTWSVNNTVDTPNEKCSYNWVDNAWVGTGTRTLTTKTDGKETEKINQNWPTGATNWVNRTCTTTVYSGANKTQEAYYSWINNAWTGVKRTDYHYNAANKNDTTIAYTYSNNDWVWYSRIVNTFNASGKNIMTHTARWQDNAWVMVLMTRTDISDITIDGIRQTLNASWKCNADSVWIGVQKDTAAYSPTGKKLYDAHYVSWANNDWVPSYKIEHEYDAADRETMNKRMDWVKNKWQGHYLFEYEYDDQGRQTSYTYYGDWDSSTNSWEGSSKYDYVYASNGQYAQQVMYRWQNNQWVGLFQYFYRYDAANHEIEQLVQSYSNDAWQNSQLYIHEYRGSEVVKNNEYRWRNEQWQFLRRNEKIYDNDELAKLRREITGSWNTNGVLSSFTDKHYEYSCDPCVIRFVNYDGTLLESQTVDKGLIPSYSGETPTKPEDPEYTYEFAGWTPSVVPVTGNATYTATFTSNKRSYIITWLNEDGSEIEHETLEYGATPMHADVTKENTAEFTYAFTGWTPGIGIVTGDASYTATFSATKNSYTITWLNEDGSEIEHETLEYGATPVHADMTKENTAEYSYAFTGWTPQIESVTGNASYTATFSATKNSYTVTWLNEDGSEIEYETLEYGATPAHADITKENTAEFTYAFTGWTPAITSVTGVASYQATFSATKNTYTVTWLNEDGSEIEHETLEYGAMPQHADVSKENTAEWTYAFTGWTPQIESVTGNATYTATFTSTKNKYTITWLNDDNSQIDQTSVEYGVIPMHDDPAKQATAEFTYTFAGWDNTPIAVTGEATYKATYSAAKNSYTITWLDDDNSALGSTTLEYGVVPTHEDPTKQPTAQYGYTFAGWSPAITSVTGNATYKATYTDTINQYTISWLDDTGTLVDQTKVAYGATPAHVNIYKESDDQYDYTFVGWTPTLVPVTGDASYSAIFTTAGKSYTVTFYFEDGVTILDQMTLPYGAIPSTPYIPSIPSDANHTYTFSGWSPEIAPVTGDISYVPTFTAIPNQYTVIFRNYNGKELQRKKVDYGTIPEYEGDEPSRPATNSYTWAFEGWTPELTAVIGDATYTAVYTKVMNTYTILFYDEDGITLLDEVTVEHGQKPTTSVIPTKEADEEYRYTFAGWSPKIAKATMDATYTATYTATPKTQDLNNTEAEGAAIKVIIEDKIYIRRGGNTYSIDGQRVK